MRWITLRLLILCVIVLVTNARELRWDWQKIDCSDIYFPPEFIWGCSDSAFQTEGIVTADQKTIENSWTEFESRNLAPVRAGVACQRWQYYQEDMQRLADCSMNGYRFSIEWAKIEPEEGKFNAAALQHYEDQIDHLLQHNITPILTLFHHTVPVWFARKGGFEKYTNGGYFVRFAFQVFKRLHRKVTHWILFNEPVAYALEGYYRGVYPPGKKNLRSAGKVSKHLLDLHVETALLFKQHDVRVQVGIAHMFNPLDSFNPYNLFERYAVQFFDYLVNHSTIDFFKTGIFKWSPFTTHINKDAPSTLDFIGINYYTHTTIKHTSWFKMEPHPRLDETVLNDANNDPDRVKVVYPEGLYRGIQAAATLNKPIYITENGVATSDPVLREQYIKQHLYVLSKALRDGFKVKGYFFWTLTDGFGWCKEYKNKHGIYEVNFETQERTFRSSTQYLLDVIKQFNHPSKQ